MTTTKTETTKRTTTSTTKKPSTTKKTTTAKNTTSSTAKKPSTTSKKTTTTSKTVKAKKEILLSIKHLDTKFKNKDSTKIVHNDLNLDIYDGEVLSIIGSNGAGKTVLAETIIGIRKVQKGEISVLDADFNLRTQSSIQFQNEDNASDMITPRNTITFYKKFFRKRVSEELVSEMIRVFGVEEFLDTKTDKLSGGQRQRLNLLLAMINRPRLLILDEFTTGLDITSVIGILNYIMKYIKESKSTLIVITHSSKEIKMLAERVVLLKDGKISAEFTTKEIETKYKGDFDQFLIDQISDESEGEYLNV